MVGSPKGFLFPLASPCGGVLSLPGDEWGFGEESMGGTKEGRKETFCVSRPVPTLFTSSALLNHPRNFGRSCASHLTDEEQGLERL